MGLFFTLLFIFAAYLPPAGLIGSADLHVEVILAAITLFVSLFAIADAGLLRMTQTYAIFGLCAAVVMSIVTTGWLGGASAALYNFLPSVMAFFFVVINCRTKFHLQMLVAGIFFVALFYIVSGYTAIAAGEHVSNYLYAMGNENGEIFYRIRGLGFFNDPNDLAQMIVVLIPCMFIFWGKGKAVRNLFLVLLPVGILIYGMYLTHSRGGMLALMVVILFAARRKIGLIPSIITVVVLFLGLSVVGWNGGRSSTDGEDRLELWSTGLSLIRSHPLFGVGYMNFTDYAPQTAHNTVIVCAAETGLTGLFCWTVFVFSTIRNAAVGESLKAPKSGDVQEDDGPDPRRGRVSSATPVSNAYPMENRAPTLQAAVASGQGMALASVEPSTIVETKLPLTRPNDSPFWDDELEAKRALVEDQDLRRMSSMMLISMAGFLTAGWFLSRSYIMLLFVNGGIATVIYRMGLEKGLFPEPLPLPRAMKLSAPVTLVLILLVYVIVRASHLLPS